MAELAKSWAQGIHDQMTEENDLEDEIDLPAPIRRGSLCLYEDEETEDFEFFGITDE